MDIKDYKKKQDEYFNSEEYKDKRRIEILNDPECMSNWYPNIIASGVRVPKTILIRCEDLCQILDNKLDMEVLNKLQDDIDNAVTELSGYPVFLRSGLTSNKHSWKNSCYLQSKEDIISHVYEIVESIYAYDIGSMSTSVWAVRELIDTYKPFHAFYGELPITKERRYFVRDGKVVFHHPYWPPFAIKEPSVENWDGLLNEINRESVEEIRYLTQQSELVGKHLNGYWSIDWLQDKNGVWWCIDAARGELSFIWSDYVMPNFDN